MHAVASDACLDIASLGHALESLLLTWPIVGFYGVSRTFCCLHVAAVRPAWHKDHAALHQVPAAAAADGRDRHTQRGQAHQRACTSLPRC